MDLLAEISKTARIWRKHAVSKNKALIQWEYWIYISKKEPWFDQYALQFLVDGHRFSELTRARKSTAYPTITADPATGHEIYSRLQSTRRLHKEAERDLKRLLRDAWPIYTSSEDRQRLAKAYDSSLVTLYVQTKRWGIRDE